MKPGERQVAPTLDGIRADHVNRYRWAAALLPKGSRVVDLACGVGYGASVLADAGHEVLGLDIDEEAIAYAREHYKRETNDFYVSDVAEFAGKVDAAVCFEAIEHIQDPRPMLRLMRDSAGLLIASVPNESAFPFQNYAFHYRHYTKDEFEALLNECGWEALEWHGQAGPKSEVNGTLMGRTLIVVAKPGKEIKPQRPMPEHAAPSHVVILGLGPSLRQYTEIVKRAGSRRAFCDEVWSINALGDVFACDRVFHMDDVRIQEVRAAANPKSNIAAMLGWLKTHPGPIYTSNPHPDYPGLVDYPLEDVINNIGMAYQNNTAAHAVAFAIYLGVKKITLFGCDFTYANSHHAEKGRACVEFLLGVAHARGIQLGMPRESSLMDACEAFGDRLYGYDVRKAKVVADPVGGFNVEFSEAEALPTAAEIEAKYDHTKHPNSIVQGDTNAAIRC